MQNRSVHNPLIIDVSHHQGKIDWNRVARSGVQGAYIKLTEGKTFTDPRVYENYDGAKRAGLPVGFYHYAHCTNDPKQEVAFFLQQLQSMEFDFPPCLDLEVNKGKSPEFVSRFGQAWLKEMEKNTGVQPLLYSGYHFAKTYFSKELSHYPLWIARYSISNRAEGFDCPGNLLGWSEWAMFQYTDQGKVEGISTHVDLNEMNIAFFQDITEAKPGILSTVATSFQQIKSQFVKRPKSSLPKSILKKGARGEEVYTLQKALASVYFYPNKSAPNHGIDGIYGANTADAVARFQKVYLPKEVDGIYGPNVRVKLEKVMKEQ
ncbi:GH25 family lysozyme [Priestia flexa]|uniref:GH25 family lysozyme n=1 Tax=Priestia flexa TaxID=86664 RepID=UPI00289225E8|nr:GH25 family lysozyme [Priestia flexa]MDT2045930.1 GH25 family lysozyme [Priestia flexa]